MNQPQKYEYALRLLKELNCPEGIMDELEIWGLRIKDDEVNLQNWLSPGGVIEGEARELPDEPRALQ